MEEFGKRLYQNSIKMDKGEGECKNYLHVSFTDTYYMTGSCSVM